MKRKLYALLAGINKYTKRVRPLKGCIDDVQDVKEFLETHFSDFELHIEALIDSQASRGNIIRGFRNHLGQAGEQDAVLFYFSGHGSRVEAPLAFEEYEPDGCHESLVCYDSRLKNGLDLADKELAVLFSEVAAKRPHILAIFDCCHSGSGVRDPGDFLPETARFTDGNSNSRPLSSYLDGYFLENGIRIPKSKMVLMAACNKTEKAWENTQRRGIFTYHLLKVLRDCGGKTSYADVFPKIRAAVLNDSRNQTPQMECYEGFNAHGLFLDGRPDPASHRCKIYYRKNSWNINRGVLHGFPDDPLNPVKIIVYVSGETPGNAGDECEVFAYTTVMGLQESKIEVEQPGLLDMKQEYRGDVITFAVPPLEVYLSGEERGMKIIAAALNTLTSRREFPAIIQFQSSPASAEYEVKCAPDDCRIVERNTQREIFAVNDYTEESVLCLLAQLARIERWKRTLHMKNPGSQLPRRDIDFSFYEAPEDEEEIKHVADDTGSINLAYRDREGDTGGVPFALKVKNNNKRKKLFFTLLHLSQDFGIKSLVSCRHIPFSSKEIILDAGNEITITGENSTEAVDAFLLLVTTEQVEDYLFTQDEIGTVYHFRGNEKRGELKKTRGDWFTQCITVKTVRNR